jgi:IMP dehydrogenase
MRKAYSFDDVLLVPQYSEVASRGDCNTSTSLPKLKLKIPIFAANMDTICGSQMAAKMGSLGGCGIVHRYMRVSETFNIINAWHLLEESYPLVLAVGSISHDKRRIDTILQASVEGCNVGLCIDLAHGDSFHVLDTLDYIRTKKDFDGLVIAGNVCTFDGAARLLVAGADIVKVGVGGGSACTTRIKTGCGYPQLAAVEECAKAGPIIADGGIRNYGDAAKALAVGAEAVMIGGLLAGTDCTPNWRSTTKELEFRGMASKEARESCGGRASYAEGITTTVLAKEEGSTEQVITELVEGIKSAMAYAGAKTIREFWAKSQLVQVTNTTREENKPHIIT